MKTHNLFCYLLVFITCCVFIWKAESTFSVVLGYIVLMISIVVIGNYIIDKPVQRNR
ncbi:MAG: hypothetical protein ABI760_19780 [Ferruginibacter sp.]